MPGRQSHGVAPSQGFSTKSKKSKSRANSKIQKRALDAFSIASHQNPENVKIRKSRLGASEGKKRPGKRPRKEEISDEGENDDADEEQSSAKRQKKGPAKGRFDELDFDAGSDSEGNEWKLGAVDSNDDSDLDSDAAFGESDEEKFEGFAFSGGSEKKSSKKIKPARNKDINLDEDEEMEDSDSELEDGDLGEGAVDLADMLDVSDDEDDVPHDQKLDASGSGSEGGEESEESDEESSISSADDDESSDPRKFGAIQDLIASLPQADRSNRVHTKHRSDGASEYNTASDFGMTSMSGITFEDLGLSTGKNQSKVLKSKKSATLEVPLAKREQDRLDRSVAYDKTKETLDRWTDTVKHNRRADHLIFPLPDNDVASAHANSRLPLTGSSKPFNELEATIQSILEESGLATVNGKDDEDHIREFEELEANKLSIEEVKARRQQLRMARELMFREEAKSKRIKKIKSKSYRKVHRKQREKEERQNQEALAEGGFVPSEDELEAQDRRRATERMGARHRGSKWAKVTKATGRAEWDEDARDAITEMARRDEELRKRVEGRAGRREGEDDSEVSSSDSSDEESDDDEDAEQSKVLRQLQKVRDTDMIDESAPGGKLANMKFMRKAEAARKKENDAMVEDMRRELAGEDTPDEEEDADIGRRLFGPLSNKSSEVPKKSSKASEFEEANSSEGEVEWELEVQGVDNDPEGTASKPKLTKTKGPALGSELSASRSQPEEPSGGAWSKAPLKNDTISHAEAKRRQQKKNHAIEVDIDLSKAAVISKPQKPKKSVNKSIAHGLSAEEDSDNEAAVHLPFAIRDQELIKRAFAGADVVGEFESEKKQTIEDDGEKIIDNTLPGWGAWTGDGVSKREQKQNKGRFLTKTEGIKEQNRKDAKLERVIINEKRIKKVCYRKVLHESGGYFD